MKLPPLRFTPLGLSLLAALVLHLLGLSAWQLQRSRQRPPARLTAADDTPLLLQFSRQVPETADLQAVPLPPATPLPPPPPEPPARATGQMAASPSARSGRQGKSQVPTASSRRGGGRPADARLPAGSRAGRTAAGPSEPPDLREGSIAREALQRALQEAAAHRDAGAQSPEAGSGSREPDPGTGSSGPEQQRPDPATERLWLLARPARLPQSRLAGLPPGLELRRLPLELARRSGAKPVHLSGLRQGERLILLWIDGPTLWLLSAPIAGPAPGSLGEGPGAGRG